MAAIIAVEDDSPHRAAYDNADLIFEEHWQTKSIHVKGASLSEIRHVEDKTVDALDFHWSCASLVLAVVSMVSSQSVMLSPSGEGTRSGASRPKTVGQAPDTALHYRTRLVIRYTCIGQVGDHTMW